MINLKKNNKKEEGYNEKLPSFLIEYVELSVSEIEVVLACKITCKDACQRHTYTITGKRGFVADSFFSMLEVSIIH